MYWLHVAKRVWLYKVSDGCPLYYYSHKIRPPDNSIFLQVGQDKHSVKNVIKLLRCCLASYHVILKWLLMSQLVFHQCLTIRCRWKIITCFFFIYTPIRFILRTSIGQAFLTDGLLVTVFYKIWKAWFFYIFLNSQVSANS